MGMTADVRSDVSIPGVKLLILLTLTFVSLDPNCDTNPAAEGT